MDVAAQDNGRWRLLNGFSFLLVHYDERRRYNVLSLLSALLVTLVYWSTPAKPPLMGDSGLLKDLKDFVQVLFPFYVGALAALATFSREGLDELTVGGKAYIVRGGREVEFTRRQFVCSIFGYCAVLSMFLFIAVIFAKMLQPFIIGTLASYGELARTAVVFLFALGFSHLAVISLWGIYYLANRLNR